MTQAILFGAISVLGVLAALGTVLARNLVHAALYLIAFFFIIACQFVLLEAEFLAAVQVLVYIGAVAILLMFGIMLTRNILGDDTTTVPRRVKQVALAVSLGVFTILAMGITLQSHESGGRKAWKDVIERPSIGPGEEDRATLKALSVNQMARFVGRELLSRYVVAFEVAGILLTAALVGAVVIAHQERDDDPASRVRQMENAENGDPDSTLAAATSNSNQSALTSSLTR